MYPLSYVTRPQADGSYVYVVIERQTQTPLRILGAEVTFKTLADVLTFLRSYNR